MDCPHWGSGETSRRRRRTALGYPRFNCRACGRRFHERTGTPFNDLQDPTDIVRLAVLGRLRYTLRFRAVVALLLQRGDAVTHETIRNWECCCAPLWADPLRAKRRGRAGVAWSIDETSVKGAGRWCYLDRAQRSRGGTPRFEAEGAARHACRPALPAPPGGRGRAQARACHDGPASALPPSDPLDPGENGAAPMQSIPEHPHRAQQRAIKPRDDPLLGCGSFASAARCCSAFAARRQYCRVGQRGAEWVPLAEQRRLVVQRWRSLIAEMTAA